MAHLIPSFFDDKTPPGERDVFAVLAGAPDDWIAIHSLDLAPWNRGLRTELDFLVVIPDIGILCIEVKSHDKIDFDGKMWHPPSIKRSPFKQAMDSRYTFARRLVELLPSLSHVPVVHLCIFPRARFELRGNLSVQSWELIDRDSFAEAATPAAFAQSVSARMVRSIEADAALRKLPRPLTPQQLELLVNHCVPVQRRRPSAREEIERRRQEIERVLRVQQAPVLALSILNRRLLVTGPAGTGKTLIALEVAQRAAESGRRVAFLCHNQLVGDWVGSKCSEGGAPPNLVAGRAIKILAGLAGIAIPAHPSPSFWDAELPLMLEEKLTDPEFEAQAAFDYLVLDEVQDLMARPALWHSLGLFLAGGFARGSYALFGDFRNQSLGREKEASRTLDSLVDTVAPARWELAENCRNYRVIGEAAAVLAGTGKNLYSGYLRTGGSSRDYAIEFYSDADGQDLHILKALRDFKERGFKPSEITLLSFRADEYSAAGRLRAGGALLARHSPLADRTTFASIHAFKGMENRVIVLTDLALTDAAFERSLFYTGLTRATESVLVLCNESSRPTLARWLNA